MIVLFSWYFFNLLNAYYGGAMTMFFTSEATLPFETMKDVIGAYPGMNCIKIDLPGKLILRDYLQENRTSQRPFLLLRIDFPGRPIVIQLPPGWKLMMQSGNEIYFISKALDGDPYFNTFLGRMRDKPSETGLCKLQGCCNLDKLLKSL